MLQLFDGPIASQSLALFDAEQEFCVFFSKPLFESVANDRWMNTQASRWLH